MLFPTDALFFFPFSFLICKNCARFSFLFARASKIKRRAQIKSARKIEDLAPKKFSSCLSARNNYYKRALKQDDSSKKNLRFFLKTLFFFLKTEKSKKKQNYKQRQNHYFFAKTKKFKARALLFFALPLFCLKIKKRLFGFCFATTFPLLRNKSFCFATTFPLLRNKSFCFAKTFPLFPVFCKAKNNKLFFFKRNKSFCFAKTFVFFSCPGFFFKGAYNFLRKRNNAFLIFFFKGSSVFVSQKLFLFFQFFAKQKTASFFFLKETLFLFFQFFAKQKTASFFFLKETKHFFEMQEGQLKKRNAGRAIKKKAKNSDPVLSSVFAFSLKYCPSCFSFKLFFLKAKKKKKFCFFFKILPFLFFFQTKRKEKKEVLKKAFSKKMQEIFLFGFLPKKKKKGQKNKRISCISSKCKETSQTINKKQNQKSKAKPKKIKAKTEDKTGNQKKLVAFLRNARRTNIIRQEFKDKATRFSKTEAKIEDRENSQKLVLKKFMLVFKEKNCPSLRFTMEAFKIFTKLYMTSLTLSSTLAHKLNISFKIGEQRKIRNFQRMFKNYIKKLGPFIWPPNNGASSNNAKKIWRAVAKKFCLGARFSSYKKFALPAFLFFKNQKNAASQAKPQIKSKTKNIPGALKLFEAPFLNCPFRAKNNKLRLLPLQINLKGQKNKRNLSAYNKFKAPFLNCPFRAKNNKLRLLPLQINLKGQKNKRNLSAYNKFKAPFLNCPFRAKNNKLRLLPLQINLKGQKNKRNLSASNNFKAPFLNCPFRAKNNKLRPAPYFFLPFQGKQKKGAENPGALKLFEAPYLNNKLRLLPLQINLKGQKNKRNLSALKLFEAPFLNCPFRAKNNKLRPAFLFFKKKRNAASQAKQSLFLNDLQKPKSFFLRGFGQKIFFGTFNPKKNHLLTTPLGLKKLFFKYFLKWLLEYNLTGFFEKANIEWHYSNNPYYKTLLVLQNNYFARANNSYNSFFLKLVLKKFASQIFERAPKQEQFFGTPCLFALPVFASQKTLFKNKSSIFLSHFLFFRQEKNGLDEYLLHKSKLVVGSESFSPQILFSFKKPKKAFKKKGSSVFANHFFVLLGCCFCKQNQSLLFLFLLLLFLQAKTGKEKNRISFLFFEGQKIWRNFSQEKSSISFCAFLHRIKNKGIFQAQFICSKTPILNNWRALLIFCQIFAFFCKKKQRFGKKLKARAKKHQFFGEAYYLIRGAFFLRAKKFLAISFFGRDFINKLIIFGKNSRKFQKIEHFLTKFINQRGLKKKDIQQNTRVGTTVNSLIMPNHRFAKIIILQRRGKSTIWHYFLSSCLSALRILISARQILAVLIFFCPSKKKKACCFLQNKKQGAFFSGAYNNYKAPEKKSRARKKRNAMLIRFEEPKIRSKGVKNIGQGFNFFNYQFVYIKKLYKYHQFLRKKNFFLEQKIPKLPPSLAFFLKKFEVCTKIKGENKSAPFIFLSASPNQFLILRFLRSKASLFLNNYKRAPYYYYKQKKLETWRALIKIISARQEDKFLGIFSIYSLQSHQSKIQYLLLNSGNKPIHILINKINSTIRYWLNISFHPKMIIGNISKTHFKLNKALFKYLWNWAKKRHNNRKKYWIFQKYWRLINLPTKQNFFVASETQILKAESQKFASQKNILVKKIKKRCALIIIICARLASEMQRNFFIFFFLKGRFFLHFLLFFEVCPSNKFRAVKKQLALGFEKKGQEKKCKEAKTYNNSKLLYWARAYNSYNSYLRAAFLAFLRNAMLLSFLQVKRSFVFKKKQKAKTEEPFFDFQAKKRRNARRARKKKHFFEMQQRSIRKSKASLYLQDRSINYSKNQKLAYTILGANQTIYNIGPILCQYTPKIRESYKILFALKFEKKQKQDKKEKAPFKFFFEARANNYDKRAPYNYYKARLNKKKEFFCRKNPKIVSARPTGFLFFAKKSNLSTVKTSYLLNYSVGPIYCKDPSILGYNYSCCQKNSFCLLLKKKINLRLFGFCKSFPASKEKQRSKKNKTRDSYNSPVFCEAKNSKHVLKKFASQIYERAPSDTYYLGIWRGDRPNLRFAQINDFGSARTSHVPPNPQNFWGFGLSPNPLYKLHFIRAYLISQFSKSPNNKYPKARAQKFAKQIFLKHAFLHFEEMQENYKGLLSCFFWRALLINYKRAPYNYVFAKNLSARNKKLVFKKFASQIFERALKQEEEALFFQQNQKLSTLQKILSGAFLINYKRASDQEGRKVFKRVRAINYLGAPEIFSCWERAYHYYLRAAFYGSSSLIRFEEPKNCHKKPRANNNDKRAQISKKSARLSLLFARASKKNLKEAWVNPLTLLYGANLYAFAGFFGFCKSFFCFAFAKQKAKTFPLFPVFCKAKNSKPRSKGIRHQSSSPIYSIESTHQKTYLKLNSDLKYYSYCKDLTSLNKYTHHFAQYF